MSTHTVAQLAQLLGRPVNTLIEQLAAAGLAKQSADDELTEQDKVRLLEHLRTSHGTAPTGERKKISIALKQGDASGKARTIQVEVRKKRTFVKRAEAPSAEEPAASAAPVVDEAELERRAEEARRRAEVLRLQEEDLAETQPRREAQAQRERDEAEARAQAAVGKAASETAADVAMTLATRCANCGTVFHVVQNQLKVSEGWVRCGRCSDMFNALEGLFLVESGVAPASTPSQRGALGPFQRERDEAEARAQAVVEKAASEMAAGTLTGETSHAAEAPATETAKPALRVVKAVDTGAAEKQRLADLERRRKAAESEAAAIRAMMSAPKRVIQRERDEAEARAQAAVDKAAREMAAGTLTGETSRAAEAPATETAKPALRVVNAVDAGAAERQRLADLERRRKAAESEAAAIRAMMSAPQRVMVAKKPEELMPAVVGAAGGSTESEPYRLCRAIGSRWSVFDSLDNPAYADHEEGRQRQLFLAMAGAGRFHQAHDELCRLVDLAMSGACLGWHSIDERTELRDEFMVGRYSRLQKQCYYRLVANLVHDLAELTEHLFGQQQGRIHLARELELRRVVVRAARRDLFFTLEEQAETGLWEPDGPLDVGIEPLHMLGDVGLCREFGSDYLLDGWTSLLDCLEEHRRYFHSMSYHDLALKFEEEQLAIGIQLEAFSGHDLAWIDRNDGGAGGFRDPDLPPRVYDSSDSSSVPDMRGWLRNQNALVELLSSAPRLLCMAHERVGQTARVLGNLALAAEAHNQQIRCARRRLKQDGRSVDALNGLRIALWRKGSVHGLVGGTEARETAAGHFEEAADVCRRLIAAEGETSRHLGRLADCVWRKAEVERLLLRSEHATQLERESLELKRKSLEIRAPEKRNEIELAECLQQLCDVLSRLGNAEAAGECAHRRLQVLRSLLATAPGTRSRALVDVFDAFEQIVSLAWKQGHGAKALAYLQDEWATVEQTLNSDRSPRILSAARNCRMWMAFIAQESGDLDGAYRLHTDCVELDEEALVKAGGSATLALGLCDTLISLGQCEELLGIEGSAHQRYERAAELASDASKRFGRTASVLQTWGQALQRLGHLNLSIARVELDGAKVARLDAARKYLGQSVDIARAVIRTFGDTPIASRNLSAAVVGQGDVAAEHGWLHDALAQYEVALDIHLRAEKNGASLDVLRDLRDCLGRVAGIEARLENTSSAKERFAQQIGASRRVIELEGQSGRGIRDLCLGLTRLCAVELKQGNREAAVDLAHEAASALIQVNERAASWPGDACEVSEQLSRLAAEHLIAVSSAFEHRVRLWHGLSRFVDLNDPETVNRVRPEILRFHSIWLALAMDMGSSFVPEIVAGMQGRKLAALAVDEAAARRRARLQMLTVELRQRELGLSTVTGAQDRSRRTAFRALQTEIARLKDELAGSKESGEADWLRIDAERLQSSLEKDSAIVLLVNRPAAVETDGVSGTVALVLRRDTCSPIVALKQLASVTSGVRMAAIHGERQPGQRYSGLRDPGRGAPANEDVEPVASLAVALWEPLLPLLAGVRSVHVVTQGELHIVPAETDAPKGTRVYQYPGLIFYWLQQQAWSGSVSNGVSTSTSSPASSLAVQVYSPPQANEMTPIPFVDVELLHAKALWSPVHMPLPLDQDMHVAMLHVAGHGQAGRDQEASLLIGPGSRLGLQELLNSRLRPEIVYLSACLVGRTSDDLDGDPLGMVSGFFLRGARGVVAPLVPISDFHAPLLAMLFHHALRDRNEQGHGWDACAALGLAKDQLRSGNWPREVIASVRAHYRPVIAQEIARVMAEEEDALNALSRMFIAWLCPAYEPKDLNAADDGPREVARKAGADASADVVLHWLVRARPRLKSVPGVLGLLRYMKVFGAPALKGHT